MASWTDFAAAPPGRPRPTWTYSQQDATGTGQEQHPRGTARQHTATLPTEFHQVKAMSSRDSHRGYHLRRSNQNQVLQSDGRGGVTSDGGVALRDSSGDRISLPPHPDAMGRSERERPSGEPMQGGRWSYAQNPAYRSVHSQPFHSSALPPATRSTRPPVVAAPEPSSGTGQGRNEESQQHYRQPYPVNQRTQRWESNGSGNMVANASDGRITRLRSDSASEAASVLYPDPEPILADDPSVTASTPQHHISRPNGSFDYGHARRGGGGMEGRKRTGSDPPGRVTGQTGSSNGGWQKQERNYGTPTRKAYGQHGHHVRKDVDVTATPTPSTMTDRSANTRTTAVSTAVTNTTTSTAVDMKFGHPPQHQRGQRHYQQHVPSPKPFPIIESENTMHLPTGESAGVVERRSGAGETFDECRTDRMPQMKQEITHDGIAAPVNRPNISEQGTASPVRGGNASSGIATTASGAQFRSRFFRAAAAAAAHGSGGGANDADRTMRVAPNVGGIAPESFPSTGGVVPGSSEPRANSISHDSDRRNEPKSNAVSVQAKKTPLETGGKSSDEPPSFASGNNHVKSTTPLDSSQQRQSEHSIRRTGSYSTSDSAGRDSVARLVARINSVDRNDPSSALAAIDEICAIEKYNGEPPVFSGEKEPAEFGGGQAAGYHQMPQTTFVSEDDELKSFLTSSDEDGDEDDGSLASTVSSITNPTYHGNLPRYAMRSTGVTTFHQQSYHHDPSQQYQLRHQQERNHLSSYRHADTSKHLDAANQQNVEDPKFQPSQDLFHHLTTPPKVKRQLLPREAQEAGADSNNVPSTGVNHVRISTGDKNTTAAFSSPGQLAREYVSPVVSPEASFTLPAPPTWSRLREEEVEDTQRRQERNRSSSNTYFTDGKRGINMTPTTSPPPSRGPFDKTETEPMSESVAACFPLSTPVSKSHSDRMPKWRSSRSNNESMKATPSRSFEDPYIDQSKIIAGAFAGVDISFDDPGKDEDAAENGGGAFKTSIASDDSSDRPVDVSPFTAQNVSLFDSLYSDIDNEGRDSGRRQMSDIGVRTYDKQSNLRKFYSRQSKKAKPPKALQEMKARFGIGAHISGTGAAGVGEAVSETQSDIFPSAELEKGNPSRDRVDRVHEVDAILREFEESLKSSKPTKERGGMNKFLSKTFSR